MSITSIVRAAACLLLVHIVVISLDSARAEPQLVYGSRVEFLSTLANQGEVNLHFAPDGSLSSDTQSAFLVVTASNGQVSRRCAIIECPTVDSTTTLRYAFAERPQSFASRDCLEILNLRSCSSGWVAACGVPYDPHYVRQSQAWVATGDPSRQEPAVALTESPPALLGCASNIVTSVSRDVSIPGFMRVSLRLKGASGESLFLANELSLFSPTRASPSWREDFCKGGTDSSIIVFSNLAPERFRSVIFCFDPKRGPAELWRVEEDEVEKCAGGKVRWKVPCVCEAASDVVTFIAVVDRARDESSAVLVRLRSEDGEILSCAEIKREALPLRRPLYVPERNWIIYTQRALGVSSAATLVCRDASTADIKQQWTCDESEWPIGMVLGKAVVSVSNQRVVQRTMERGDEPTILLDIKNN